MSKGVMYVDNIRVEYDNEPNVLEVCRKAGVEIPNFCFHSDLSVYGACRMCMVEEEGTGKIDAACTMPPKNELHIRTNTARLLKYRRMIIELLLSAHCRDCTTCEKNRACRLQEMAVRFGIHRAFQRVQISVDVGNDQQLHMLSAFQAAPYSRQRR